MTLNEALLLWDKQEALHLLSFITGYTPTDILVYGERTLADAERYKDCIKQRKNHVPLQYIIGRWDFMGFTYKVDERALIPRQDTEIIAEAVLKHIKGTEKVLDVCTGSGCLAVSLAKLSAARLTAIDLSPQALSLAKENAAFHGVSDRINFIESDLLDGLQEKDFDIILANPPYIPTKEIPELQAEVSRHEPYMALDGGEDGLTLYRRLIPQSLKHLRPGGALFLEIGHWEGVVELMRISGFNNIQTMHDYAGFKRVVYGIK